jgi:LPXTG-site transpeptidase (sortase) family protein
MKATNKSLEVSIARLYGTPNQIGNFVIGGHNYKNGLFFSNNYKLEEGDKVYVTDVTGKKVEYIIYKKYETLADDYEYWYRDTAGKREVSLTTCNDDSTLRLVLWAKEK